MISKNLFPDWFLTLPALLLAIFSIFVIYSSDPRLALNQFIFMGVGLIFYYALSLIDFEYYNDFIPYFYFAILFFLVVVFALGVETRGSLRWIPLGIFQFQPSEFAKPVLILFLSRFWTLHLPTWKNALISFLWVVPLFALIFKQPDLGTAMTILVIWLMMLIGSNISMLKIFIMIIVSSLSAPLGWHFLKEYQRQRILSFLSPQQDPLGVGYNVIQSTIAVGSGQFWGRGLGRGTQSRLNFLPEFRTDFIFASIAEEFGFIGSLLVLFLYAILVGRCLRIISTNKSRFGNLLIFGFLGMLIFQSTINIGMNVGLVPITGITLPLISYGGSSMIATLISLGLVASAARFSKASEIAEV